MLGAMTVRYQSVVQRQNLILNEHEFDFIEHFDSR